MITCNYLTLNDIVYFKEPTTFAFERGLTFVQGKNNQRKGGVNPSNGAGKSLLFSVLPNILFDASSVVQKNGRRVQKTVFNSPKSYIELGFSTGGNDYQYIKYASKAVVKINGKDVNSRQPRKMLESIIGLTEEEFWATVFCDSRRQQMLQLGTSSERFQFFTNLFRLGVLDENRRKINQELNTLGSERRVLDATQELLNDLTEKLQSIPENAVANADRLTRWLPTATDNLQTMTLQTKEWDNYDAYLESKSASNAVRKQLLELLKGTTSLKEGKLAVTKTLAILTNYERDKAKWDKRTSDYRKVVLRKSELDALNLPVSQYEARLKDKAKLEIVQKPEAIPDVTKLLSIIGKETIDSAKAKLANASAEKKAIQDVLQFLTKNGHQVGICPTCGTHLTKKQLVTITVALDKQILALANKESEAHSLIAAIRKMDRANSIKEQWNAYEEYKVKREKLRAFPFEEIKEYEALISRLAYFSEYDTKEPKVPDTPIDLSIEECEKVEALFTKYSKLLAVTESRYCDKPDYERVSQQDIANLNEKISKYLEKLPKLQSNVALKQEWEKNAKKAKAVIEDKAPKVADIAAYELLQEAYGAKGLKVLMVQSLAKALEKNMNRYSRQIFQENFKFEFAISEGNFSISVIRTAGKTSVASDVRHMSGAESRLFGFLFLLSLLPLIPESRRFNILILDEPDANMDSATREVFREVLLPKLAEIVPSVVCISPNSDMIPHQARVVTVVKDKGVSRLG